jgi:hypothetical protein
MSLVQDAGLAASLPYDRHAGVALEGVNPMARYEPRPGSSTLSRYEAPPAPLAMLHYEPPPGTLAMRRSEPQPVSSAMLCYEHGPAATAPLSPVSGAPWDPHGWPGRALPLRSIAWPHSCYIPLHTLLALAVVRPVHCIAIHGIALHYIARPGMAWVCNALLGMLLTILPRGWGEWTL